MIRKKASSKGFDLSETSMTRGLRTIDKVRPAEEGIRRD